MKENEKIQDDLDKLLGDYNILNTLSAIVLLHNMNIEDTKIQEVFKSINSPDGRLDVIKYSTNNIVIDYAHTEDAMIKVLNTARLAS